MEAKARENVREEGRLLIDRDQLYENRRLYHMVKRIQDIVVSTLLLLVLWPFILLFALMIVIDNPGANPFFVQTRIGRDGKPFAFIKLRSMVPQAESLLDDILERNEMGGPAFKIRDDPRITRIGHFIRRTGIDELPQLLNVLMGDMSMVGPRPALPREVEQYDDYMRQRLYVTPGLTCYWQIQPNRNDMSFDEWLELDLKYIREQGLGVDWKIMLKTIGAVLKMDGE